MLMDCQVSRMVECCTWSHDLVIHFLMLSWVCLVPSGLLTMDEMLSLDTVQRVYAPLYPVPAVWQSTPLEWSQLQWQSAAEQRCCCAGCVQKIDPITSKGYCCALLCKAAQHSAPIPEKLLHPSNQKVTLCKHYHLEKHVADNLCESDLQYDEHRKLVSRCCATQHYHASPWMTIHPKNHWLFNNLAQCTSWGWIKVSVSFIKLAICSAMYAEVIICQLMHPPSHQLPWHSINGSGSCGSLHKQCSGASSGNEAHDNKEEQTLCTTAEELFEAVPQLQWLYLLHFHFS